MFFVHAKQTACGKLKIRARNLISSDNGYIIKELLIVHDGGRGVGGGSMSLQFLLLRE